MNKGYIEYQIDNGNLDIEKLLRVKYNTKKYYISKDMLSYLEEQINDKIELGKELIKTNEKI